MFHFIVRTFLLGSLVAVVSASTAQAAVIKTDCGAPIQSSVLTRNASARPFQTASTSFVRVPGAALKFAVPAGTTRCVKVRFSPQGTCQGGAFCSTQAVADGVEMTPGFMSGNDMRDSYQWVDRLAAGTHVVQVQVRRTSGNSDAKVEIDYWGLEVEILK